MRKLSKNQQFTVKIRAWVNNDYYPVLLEGIAVFADFPCGNGKGALMLPKIVACDVNGQRRFYRPGGIDSTFCFWHEVNDAFANRYPQVRKYLKDVAQGGTP
jgi:hypothetical protein